MRREGFTLVELLVVIAIIALLMGILMPALSRTRQLAFRLTCGTNLSGIGKAMMVYAHDYGGRLPRAGNSQSTWGPVRLWSAPGRDAAFGLALAGPGDADPPALCSCNTRASGARNGVSISSCFYLLVKYAEVTPKSFVCKGDAGTSEFRLADLPAGTVPTTFELTDAWDFGPQPSRHCSYSYHVPFGSYGLKTSDDPGLAVAADRNPWLAGPAGPAGNLAGFRPDIPGAGAVVTAEMAKRGNTPGHQMEGQSVLFLDSHVKFERRAYCAIENDNIYTISTNSDKGSSLGVVPIVPTARPANRSDSILVHDPPEFAVGATAARHAGHR